MARLRRSDCNGPGIGRRRAGKGFSYLDEDGSRIDDPEVIERIRALAVPPAWEDVWICSDPDGHIQATGVDVKGRRQYRYHERWHSERAREKHDRILRFARRLPELREQVSRDLAGKGMTKRRVLACAVRMLELGFFRVGGEAYAKENGSFGLATLRKDHVRVRGDAVELDYTAKSGQRRRCQVVDPDITAVVRTLRRRRSDKDAELLAYRDDEGQWADVRSVDINEYVQELVGEEFTAKDFRTWVGTVLAAVLLAEEAEEETDATEAERRRSVAEATKRVARHLGNTPAVARSAYIDPRVVERFEADDTLEDPTATDDLAELEGEVVALLERARRAERRSGSRRARTGR